MKTCEIVAERVALGEPVGEADHVASCARCQRAITLPSRIAHALVEIDPGLGFSARVTAGAQHRIVLRRRRRVATGVAATALAGALGALLVLRPTSEPSIAPPSPAVATPDPWNHDHDDANKTDDDVRALVHLADIDHATHLGADWGRIEKPLSPYRSLLKGVKP